MSLQGHGPARGPRNGETAARLVHLAAALSACFAVAAIPVIPASASAAAERPSQILSWRHQVLQPAEYETLSKEWEAYINDHPRDVRAWVEWGTALRYAGQYDLAHEKYAHAFGLDSTDVAAVEAAAMVVVINDPHPAVWQLARQRLLRAAKKEPGLADAYYPLLILSLRAGDEAEAAECLRKMVELGDMPRPLIDFGYNLLAGAPPEAIVLTNGDNDTFPPLAVQTIEKLRPDVSVVNLSLLNAAWYIHYWKGKGLPITLSDAVIDTLRGQGPDRNVAVQVEEHLFRNLNASANPRPLCYSVTVSPYYKVLPAPRRLEGLLERFEYGTAAGAAGNVPPAEATPDWSRTRVLIDTRYRLDGITDPLVDWNRESAVARLCRNYTALLGGVGHWLLDSGSRSEAGPYLFRAVQVLAFHHEEDHAREVIEGWEKADPKGDLLPAAKELLTSR